MRMSITIADVAATMEAAQGSFRSTRSSAAGIGSQNCAQLLKAALYRRM